MNSYKREEEMVDLMEDGADRSVFQDIQTDPFPYVVVDDFLPEKIIGPILEKIDNYSQNLIYGANKGMRLSVLY